jgi:hypothetical protein
MARSNATPVYLSFFFDKGGLRMTESKSQMRSIRFTPAELAALRSVADERSCSVGAVVRWAVKAAVIGDQPNGRKQRNGERAKFSQDAGAAPLVQS